MVSIIIPCYNYGRFLRDAIDSGLRQQQENLAVEVLVVDDGSTDDTAEVAASYGKEIRYVRQPNAGLSAARNTGMREARYEYVVFLDADDMLETDAVKTLYAVRRDSVVVGGLAWWVDVDGKPLCVRPTDTGKLVDWEARLLVIRNRFTCTVLARKSVLLELGGFDVNLRACEDRDMWIRAAARHRVSSLQHVVLLRRIHGANMIKGATQQTACIRQVLEKAYNNPHLTLTRRDKQLALASCCYVSALMYAEAADWRTAIRQMVRSFQARPAGSMQDAAIGRFGRLRGLCGMILGSLRGGTGAK